MYKVYFMLDGKKVYYHFGRCFRFVTEKEARKKLNSLPREKRSKALIERPEGAV